MKPFRTAILPGLCAVISLISSCTVSSTQKQKEAVLFTVDSREVTSQEFEYVYTKNNFYTDSSDSRQSVEEYLDLFINFKLKVREAEVRGMDQEPQFQQELEGYRKQLAKPYLTENKVTEAMMEEAYERLKTEVKAAHILFAVSEDASPADTLRVYKEAQRIRKQLQQDADFAAMAREHSDDPSARINGGDLGYFTAMQMVYPFENAAYQTAVGEISEPVRTKFGYHLIKVKDKRPSQGKIRVAHIMVRYTRGMDQQDSVRAHRKAMELYNKLQNQQADWNELSRQFSEDVSSREKGGLLPWFGTGDMVPAFAQSAFQLENPGDISRPVLTPYGWHIIKLVERKGLDDYESMKPLLKRNVLKASRAEQNREAMLARLKQENNYRLKEKVWKQLRAQADSSLIEGQWKADESVALKDKTLFSINEENYPAGEFFDYVEAQQQKRPELSAERYMEVLFEEFTAERIIAYEEAHLTQKYPEYRYLLKEYREGILLFQLMDEQVWSKATQDTAALYQYYQRHKEEYSRGPMAQLYIYNAATPEVLKEVKDRLAEANDSAGMQQFTFRSLKNELESKYNAKTPLTLQVQEGLFERQNLPFDVNWAAGKYNFQQNGRYYLVVISELMPAGPAPFAQVKGQVISDYQDYLEKKWVEQLKEKYPVEVNDSQLQKLKKRFEEN